MKDLTGKRFGRLLVIKRVGTNPKNRQYIWLCKCDCGNYKEALTSYLTTGDTSSCGCYRKECELKNLSEFWGKIKTHGLSKTRIYAIWADMKDRCYNSKNRAYKHYGNRGIIVFEDWKNDFMAFYNWSMSNGYTDKLTIDRIDVNGNYEPNNCRWVTQKEQANNKRNSREITLFGETKTVYEFEKIYKVKALLLYNRYKKGYSDKDVIYKGDFRYGNKKQEISRVGRTLQNFN